MKAHAARQAAQSVSLHFPFPNEALGDEFDFPEFWFLTLDYVTYKCILLILPFDVVPLYFV